MTIKTKTLLISAAAFFMFSGLSFAAAPAADDVVGFKAGQALTDSLEAKRSKPRVPGGSGCDDPRDQAEHPECRVGALSIDQVPALAPKSDDQEAKRRKPRVPGGSGCDDPRDLQEHPECRPAA